MTRKISFQDIAKDELDQTTDYYCAIRLALGEQFLDEIDHAIRTLSESPHIGRVVLGEVRSWRLRMFPYSIYYRLDDEHLRVLAIGHQRRRAQYWKGRH